MIIKTATTFTTTTGKMKNMIGLITTIIIGTMRAIIGIMTTGKTTNTTGWTTTIFTKKITNKN